MDASVESQIKKCDNTTNVKPPVYKNPKGGNSTKVSPIHENYTETAFGVNMKMIWVEGGDFMMGCTSEQSDCYDSEKNVHNVTLDGFYIGMLEVTQAQWEAVVGTTIYQQRDKVDSQWPVAGVGSDYPMYFVNYDEATEFCRILSNRTGKTYTLPTEAQWEYAARGGKKSDGTKYAGSNNIDAVAWYKDNSDDSTHACGSKRSNSLGIYDMSGNVWEWCKDWYSDSYASINRAEKLHTGNAAIEISASLGDTKNPTGPSSGTGRVKRGGCKGFGASSCRVSIRGNDVPSHRHGNLGFRVVCIPK